MTSRPLLVLVHGTRFDTRQWVGYAELIPEADLMPVDLPGHGTRAGRPYSTDAARAVVEEAVGRAEPGRPVVLAGHSLGGYVSADYAHRHPGVLAGLATMGNGVLRGLVSATRARARRARRRASSRSRTGVD